MTAGDMAVLGQLPAYAFAFALVLARVGGACMLLPGIGEAELPATIRAGFALVLSAVLVPVLAPLMPPEPGTVWPLAAMVAAELLTGLLLGWLARLLLLALPMAGQFAANMAGIANVLQPDPTMGAQAAALSRLFALAATVAVLASGLYRLPISALAGSYRLIAPGAMLPSTDTAEAVTGAVAGSFALAARLASPLILANVVWQVALGLLARLVPQLQIHFAAMPGQILGGVLLLALLSAGVLAAWQGHAAAGFAALPGL
jgi:flagellar biosynthetic protein FliR